MKNEIFGFKFNPFMTYGGIAFFLGTFNTEPFWYSTVWFWSQPIVFWCMGQSIELWDFFKGKQP